MVSKNRENQIETYLGVHRAYAVFLELMETEMLGLAYIFSVACRRVEGAKQLGVVVKQHTPAFCSHN